MFETCLTEEISAEKLKGITVFSPIKGHSKRRTPLISGQFYFHRPNSGQSLIKNFLKGGQAISGHSN